MIDYTLMGSIRHSGSKEPSLTSALSEQLAVAPIKAWNLKCCGDDTWFIMGSYAEQQIPESGKDIND